MLARVGNGEGGATQLSGSRSERGNKQEGPDCPARVVAPRGARQPRTSPSPSTRTPSTHSSLLSPPRHRPGATHEQAVCTHLPLTLRGLYKGNVRATFRRVADPSVKVLVWAEDTAILARCSHLSFPSPYLSLPSLAGRPLSSKRRQTTTQTFRILKRLASGSCW